MSDQEIRKLQLEVGGSFFELIEFSLTRRIHGKTIKGVYGVNVAKVREVVRMPKINPLSSRSKGIAGVFELRGIPIPAVDLAVALGDDDQVCETHNPKLHQIIVTEFSQKRAGFIVDSTHRIRRVAWDKVLPPTADAGSCINGMTLIDKNEFLFILDLERILVTLEHGSQAGAPGAVWAPSGETSRGRPEAQPTGPRILLVDDSQFIRNGARQALMRAGYRVTEASDGAEALKIVESSAGTKDAPDLVVSDVEMPRMDGLSFTRKLRESPRFSELPVILHTSLSGRANQDAGLSVGANGYVIKNDFKTLLALVQEIIGTGAQSAA